MFYNLETRNRLTYQDKS